MSLASLVILLQTALSLLALVNANPSLPQSMRDNAQQVAQQAIAAGTGAIASLGDVSYGNKTTSSLPIISTTSSPFPVPGSTAGTGAPVSLTASTTPMSD